MKKGKSHGSSTTTIGIRDGNKVGPGSGKNTCRVVRKGVNGERQPFVRLFLCVAARG